MQKEANLQNLEVSAMERKMSFFMFLVRAEVVIQQIEKDLTGKPFWKVAETKLKNLYVEFQAQMKNFLLGSTTPLDHANSKMYLDLTIRYKELEQRIAGYKAESSAHKQEKTAARKTANKSATNGTTVIVLTPELHSNGQTNGTGRVNGAHKVAKATS